MRHQKRFRRWFPVLFCFLLAISLFSSSALAVGAGWVFVGNETRDSPYDVSTDWIIDTREYTLTASKTTAIIVHSTGKLNLKGYRVTSITAAGIEVETGGTLIIAEPVTVVGSTHALVVSSGAEVHLSSGTFTGKMGAAIQVADGDYGALLEKGYGYFDASGNPIPLADMGTATKVIVKQSADHIDHTWIETSRIPATCTAPGSVSYVCSVCSAVKTDPLAALDHEWIETSRTPAACLTPGSIDYTCSRCGETKTETIPQLGVSHIWTVSGHTDPTCTAAGVTGYTCSRCGEVKQETSPALDHDWQETARKDATCTVSGFIRYICSRCNETKTEEIPQLAQNHAWEEISRTEATCTSAGSAVSVCSRCHEEKTEEIPALDHEWEETEYTPPTCTESGSIHRSCTRCGFSVSEQVPAFGTEHTWQETSREDPTESTPGKVEYTCSTCGATKSEIIPAIGSGSMLALLSRLSSVLSSAGDWVSLVAEKIVTTPVFLVITVLASLGIGVVMFKRLSGIK